MSVGSLIQGFQQGYTFVDDVERKKGEDQYKGELRDRQRQEWTKEDDYEARRKARVEKYFGAQEEPAVTPAPENPQRMIAQEQGIAAQPQAVPMPQVQTMPMSPAPVAAPIAAPRKGMMSAAYTEAVRQTESRGRANAIGPHIPGQGSAKGDMQVMDATFSSPGFGVRPAANESMEERSRVGKDYYAALGDKYQDPALAAIAYNWGPGNADKWLAAGGDFSKLPRETQAYVGSVMTRGAVAQRGSGVRMAAEQGVAMPSAAAPASVPVNGIEMPVQTRDTKQDRMTDVGNTMRFVMEDLQDAVASGKKGGEAFLVAQKTIQGMQKEGMADAIKLMDRGMYQEAQDQFNKTGTEIGWRIVASQDAQYTAPDGKAYPTKIVTAQKSDGTKRVINTKENMFQLMELSEQVKMVSDGERNEITKAHYADAREDRKLMRSDRLEDRANLREDRSLVREDRLAERAEQANKMQYDATNRVLVNPRTGETKPLTGPNGLPVSPKEKASNATEGERKAATLLKRMEFSEQQLTDALKENSDAAKPGLLANGMRAVGAESLANTVATGSARQRVESAQLDILDSALTLGTGAAYTREQLEGYRKSYFPQIGDDAKAIRDKQDRLKNVIEAGRIAAGRAAPDSSTSAVAPQTGGAKTDKVSNPLAKAGRLSDAEQAELDQLRARFGKK